MTPMETVHIRVRMLHEMELAGRRKTTWLTVPLSESDPNSGCAWSCEVVFLWLFEELWTRIESWLCPWPLWDLAQGALLISHLLSFLICKLRRLVSILFINSSYLKVWRLWTITNKYHEKWILICLSLFCIFPFWNFDLAFRILSYLFF